jgi:hypothetical protein
MATVRKTLKSFPAIADLVLLINVPTAFCYLQELPRWPLFRRTARTFLCACNMGRRARTMPRPTAKPSAHSRRKCRGGPPGPPGQVRCANQSVFAAEAPRPGNLQTDQSKVFRMPGEIQLRLFRYDVIPNAFAEGGQERILMSACGNRILRCFRGVRLALVTIRKRRGSFPILSGVRPSSLDSTCVQSPKSAPQTQEANWRTRAFPATLRPNLVLLCYKLNTFC